MSVENEVGEERDRGCLFVGFVFALVGGKLVCEKLMRELLFRRTEPVGFGMTRTFLSDDLIAGQYTSDAISHQFERLEYSSLDKEMDSSWN